MTSSEKNLSLMNQAMDWAYSQAVNGFGILGSAQSLADEYMKNNKNKIDAANSLIRWQNTKAATGGFATNLGGLITLPVAIPANLSSSLFIQLRMIAGIAHIGGHDVHDDRIKTLCFVCLTGNGVNEVLKNAGVNFGTKFTTKAIEKYITGQMIKTINRLVGFRLVTKAGTTGIINITKLVPLVGGVIGGVFDGVTTNIIGNKARDMFISISEDLESDAAQTSTERKDPS